MLCPSTLWKTHQQTIIQSSQLLRFIPCEPALKMTYTSPNNFMMAPSAIPYLVPFSPPAYLSIRNPHLLPLHLSPDWHQAMNVEFDTLLRNGTWTLAPLSPSMNLINLKWVFKIQRKADGSVERYKACVVAKGFHHQQGLDFGETFSPVIKPTTIRIVLSLVVSHRWRIQHIDI